MRLTASSTSSRLLTKDIEDAIQVLRTIALFKKDATLGSSIGPERLHDALRQFAKTGKTRRFRHPGSAEEDDVAWIALLK